MTDVTRIRTGIWLGGDVSTFDVHTEDDMIMIEAQHGGTDDYEIFICPELFPAIRRVMDTLEGRTNDKHRSQDGGTGQATPDSAGTGVRG